MSNNLKIITAYRGMKQYIRAVKTVQNPDKKQLWMEHAIDPYWNQWAAGQFNEERTRMELSNPFDDVDQLDEAIDRIEGSEADVILHKAYCDIIRLLPFLEEEKVICIYVNTNIDHRLHGVLGTCVGDNILIQVNPLVDGWKNYIPWVLAHEYHHTVWGYHYFYMKSNTVMSLLTALITEGEADAFAQAVCPNVSPSWIRALTTDLEYEQWAALKNSLCREDCMELHVRYFFGDKETNTPPNTGYTIGYHIVQLYLKVKPETSFIELVDIDAEEILSVSGYDGR